MRRFGSILIAATLAAACTAARTSPSPSAPTDSATPTPVASVAASASPWVTIAPPPTPASRGPASPTPAPDRFVGMVAVTVSDKLRVRSEPRVSDDSIKYEPVLPLGTKLIVLDGPISGSGYTWYQVSPVSVANLDGPGFGWVAKADKDGEPWIALAQPQIDLSHGWPAVSRAGIAMLGVVADDRSGQYTGALDGRLRLSITVTGLAPSETVSLNAAGRYLVKWVCGSQPGPCGELGCVPDSLGTTEGTAKATTQVVAGSDGTATARIDLAAAPPAKPCPADSRPPLGTQRERWEQISIADPLHGLVLTRDIIERGDIY